MYEIKQAKNKVQWFLMENGCIIRVFYSFERAMDELDKKVRATNENNK